MAITRKDKEDLVKLYDHFQKCLKEIKYSLEQHNYGTANEWCEFGLNGQSRTCVSRLKLELQPPVEKVKLHVK